MLLIDGMKRIGMEWYGPFHESKHTEQRVERSALRKNEGIPMQIRLQRFDEISWNVHCVLGPPLL